MTRILVVDDDPQILRALRVNLRARGYDVDTADDGGTALKTATDNPPDLVILDLGLPDLDGVEVIGGLRGWTTVPIVVLSGRADGHDKVDALDAGADDYVTKPFGVDELLARIRAALRRTQPAAERPAIVTVGRYAVDLAGRTVSHDVKFTPTEWQILDHLLRNPGMLVSQQALLRDVWGPHYQTETNYLRQYMARLRRKLEDDPTHPKHLLTEPGMGYRFSP
ncbi:response regulator [Actinoplanes sp. NPDC026623]|uniref:response regulator n=1 Tax=Actinoplanes sp. NPDC026623 TaxID=3155610 RepID=UPI0033D61283